MNCVPEYKWVNFMLLLVGHFYTAGDTVRVVDLANIAFPR